MAAWLVKSEPSEYSFADLERDGTAEWDGVRNAQAQIHLRSMQVGDTVVVYHSMSERAAVGLARVDRAPGKQRILTVRDSLVRGLKSTALCCRERDVVFCLIRCGRLADQPTGAR